jgi:two-component system, NarL family, sensor histidine kinase DesK
MADEPAIRRATALVTVVMCLIAVSEAGYGVASGGLGEVPMIAALAVLPLLYVIPATRPLWLRHRYPLLAVQAALTYLPFAWFGVHWAPSGWLAGLVLLTVSSPESWFAAAILAALEAAIWSAVVAEMPNQSTIPAAASAMFVFVFDALVLFGLARLADLVAAVHAARDELAEAAVTAERVRAADSLRAAIGGRLAEAAGRSAAALRAIAGSPSLAREHIAATAVTAREALGEVREVAARYRNAPWPEAAPAEPGQTPAPRLAQAVLVVTLCGLAVMYSAFVATNDNGVPGGYGGPLVALTIADAVALVILQLRHSWPSRGTALSSTGRPRGWPATLLLQAVLTYALFPWTGWHPLIMCGFLAGSVLLLVPGRLGGVAFAAVIASIAVLWTVKPFPNLTNSELLAGMLFFTVESAALGLLVFGLTRLAQLAVQLADLHGELARKAVAGERLRMARDTHDLLGLGLSAIAMKADLIGKLIGRDDARAGEETADLARICATARADVRLVAGEARDLPLDAELAAARDVLVSAGIDVRMRVSADPGPETVAVLVPVVREAVTNILKHSGARCCTLELTADSSTQLRLLISNDGSDDADSAPLAAAGHTGNGLRNLADRIEAAGGQLAASREAGTFSLAVELPLPAGAPVVALEPAGLGGDPHRVHPVTAAELGHRRCQVVPHGPVGQEQLRRDCGQVRARREPPQDIGLPVRQRALLHLQRRQGQLLVDDPLPRRDPAQHVDQLVRRGVLDHEARHVRAERVAQLPGLPHYGQDHHPARWQPLVQLRRGGDPVKPWQVDVEHREVGTLRQRRGHDVRAGRHLGDDLDVILQVKHGDQRVPQNPHVLRDKDPDHHPSNRRALMGTTMCAPPLSRKPRVQAAG